MRTGFITVMAVMFALTGLKAQKETKKNLDKNDLFVLMEYKQTEYAFFPGSDQGRLPSEYSFSNNNVDINGNADSSNIIDVNYLYLDGYSRQGIDSGEVFYLITKKNRPMSNRKSNIRSSETVDRFFDINTVKDMILGNWRRDKENRLVIMLRESTDIYNMSNFRIFSGIVVNDNIYLTHAMNSKDDYLFDYNFKQNKEINVKLPVTLENVFYPVKISAQAEEKSYRMMARREKDTSVNVAIKYWSFDHNAGDFKQRGLNLFDFESVSFRFVKGGWCNKEKFVLFEAIKNGVPYYNKLKLANYYKYYDSRKFNEYLFINVEDPYQPQDERTRRGRKMFSFQVPYSAKSAAKRFVSAVKNLF